MHHGDRRELDLVFLERAEILQSQSRSWDGGRQLRTVGQISDQPFRDHLSGRFAVSGEDVVEFRGSPPHGLPQPLPEMHHVLLRDLPFVRFPAARQKRSERIVECLVVVDLVAPEETEVDPGEDGIMLVHVLDQRAHPLLCRRIDDHQHQRRAERGPSIGGEMVTEASGGEQRLPPRLFFWDSSRSMISASCAVRFLPGDADDERQLLLEGFERALGDLEFQFAKSPEDPVAGGAHGTGTSSPVTTDIPFLTPSSSQTRTDSIPSGQGRTSRACLRAPLRCAAFT